MPSLMSASAHQNSPSSDDTSLSGSDQQMSIHPEGIVRLESSLSSNDDDHLRLPETFEFFNFEARLPEADADDEEIDVVGISDDEEEIVQVDHAVSVEEIEEEFVYEEVVVFENFADAAIEDLEIPDDELEVHEIIEEDGVGFEAAICHADDKKIGRRYNRVNRIKAVAVEGATPAGRQLAIRPRRLFADEDDERPVKRRRLELDD